MAVIPELSDAKWDVFPSGQDITVDYPRWWPIAKRIKQIQTNRRGFKETPISAGTVIRNRMNRGNK
jgi:hypothetical protein